MAVSLKPIREQVIVLTGASSGIGLATARAAAARGARLVLVARNAAALDAVVRDITAAGGQAVAAPADVADRDAVGRVYATAVDRFGGFDTWVNNAGVSVWGRLHAVSDEDNRRLFETNFWGTVYGSLAAAHHLRQKGGAIVNVGSVASDLALPLQGMYSASKHAVKGFTDALRMELEEAGAPVSVTLIKPSSIDTPLPHRARNYTDREPRLPDPVYAPEEVAVAILHAAAHPVRDVFVGGGGRGLSALRQVAPRLADWVGERFVMPRELRDEPPRNPQGTLHQPGPDGEVRGDHPGPVLPNSLYTRASLHPLATGAAVAAAGLVAVWLAGTLGGPQRG